MKYVRPEMEVIEWEVNVWTDTITDSTNQVPWKPNPTSIEIGNVD